MSSYVLDTHAYQLGVTAPKKLGKAAARIMRRIERGDDEGLVPAAVATEIVMLAELGRTDIGLPELKASLQETPCLRFLPLDFAQPARHRALRTQSPRASLPPVQNTAKFNDTPSKPLSFTHAAGLVKLAVADQVASASANITWRGTSSRPFPSSTRMADRRRVMA